MMGERTVAQEALFYEFSLERHVPATRAHAAHHQIPWAQALRQHHRQGACPVCPHPRRLCQRHGEKWRIIQKRFQRDRRNWNLAKRARVALPTSRLFRMNSTADTCTSMVTGTGGRRAPSVSSLSGRPAARRCHRDRGLRARP